jgi:membrane-associated phospholipid phosphatase
MLNLLSVMASTVVTIFFIVWMASRVNPLRLVGVFVRDLWTSRLFLVHFLLLLAVLATNSLELYIEETFLQGLRNFTPEIYALEGNFVERFQRFFVTPWLTPILSFVYTALFQSVLVAALIYLTYEDRSRRRFYALCYTIMLIYVIATPFYLFFPVDEVWSYLPNVRFPMLEAFPTFETDYRPMSGINNCFPSLHTAISAAVALLAWRSHWLFRWFTRLFCLATLFTILYMGIHWVLDITSGLILAGIAAYVGTRLSHRTVRRQTAPSKNEVQRSSSASFD